MSAEQQVCRVCGATRAEADDVCPGGDEGVTVNEWEEQHCLALTQHREAAYMAGLMRARLAAAYAQEVYPVVEGIWPIDGPHLIEPGRWRATWRLRDGGTLTTEARDADGEWRVIVVG